MACLRRLSAALFLCFAPLVAALAQTATSPVPGPGSAAPGSAAVPLEAFRKAGIPATDVTLYAVAVDQNEPRIAHNADQAFVLASTTKLVTSLAALDLLGPAFRWRTAAYLNGTLSDGTLNGDLLIVGGGDPMLRSDKLQAWFAQMQKRGLKAINGNILMDRSRFSFGDKDHVNTPKPDWRNPHHAHPDALVIDEGMLQVSISGGPQGKLIQVLPAIEGFEIADQTRTVARCALVRLPVSVDFEEASQNRKLLITGDWAADCPEHHVETHPWDQAAFSAAAIAAAWKKAGGTLSGTVMEAPPPPKPVRGKRAARAAKPRKPFLVLESKPLLDSVRESNKWSNNLVSRHLMLSLSKGFPRQAATLVSAQETLRQWLQARGYAPEDITLENGSGLSRMERAKARSLATLLRDAWYTRYDKDFKSSLPVVGVDGTMGNRLKRSAATGKAMIKTGTLNDARSVAGYVTDRHQKTWAIVAIVNHANAGRAVAALDSFIEWVHAGP